LAELFSVFLKEGKRKHRFSVTRSELYCGPVMLPHMLFSTYANLTFGFVALCAEQVPEHIAKTGKTAFSKSTNQFSFLLRNKWNKTRAS